MKNADRRRWRRPFTSASRLRRASKPPTNRASSIVTCKPGTVMVHRDGPVKMLDLGPSARPVGHNQGKSFDPISGMGSFRASWMATTPLQKMA